MGGANCYGNYKQVASMYDRAPRILTRPTANTAPNVGPGTYYPAIIPHSGKFIVDTAGF